MTGVPFDDRGFTVGDGLFETVLADAGRLVLWREHLARLARGCASLDLPTKVIEDSPSRKVEVRRRPLGVIGAIVPWNFPLILMAFKVPAALLAGNPARMRKRRVYARRFLADCSGLAYQPMP